MKDYILTYDGNLAKILSNGYIFESNEKPSLGFEYDTLYYETPTMNIFKIVNGVRSDLTDEEISKIKEYCDNFELTADFMVSAYDKESLVYAGDMLKSTAVEKDYGFVINDTPTNKASKYMTDHWVRIKAVIRDDGTYTIDPAYICSSCVLFFTEEEWMAFESKPMRNDDRFNFVTNKFEDMRLFETLKYEVTTDIRNYFERIRWKEWDKYIPQYEQATWQIQVQEANNYFSDRETAKTPYADAFLSARTDSEVPTKEDFLKDVLRNNEAYTVAMAKVNAEQWGWLKKVENCTTNKELDVIRNSISELNNTAGRQRYRNE